MTPQPAETTTTIQYGIERPDGEIVWDAYSPSSGHNYPLATVHNSASTRMALEETLVTIATRAGIDPQGYLDAHQLVTRDVITITMGVQRGITLVAR